MKLSKLFYDRDTCQVAQDLLGKYLVRVQNGIPLVVRIQETEAYVGPMDKACHAYNYRRTARTETLFAPPGTAYIYLIYGMHSCVNVVANVPGKPEAVLIRALMPDRGLEQMYVRRPKAKKDLQLCSGPGKLCAALDITRAQYGLDLTGDELWIEDRAETPEIQASPRIGVEYAKECGGKPWRFTLAGSPWVSVKPPREE